MYEYVRECCMHDVCSEREGATVEFFCTNARKRSEVSCSLLTNVKILLFGIIVSTRYQLAYETRRFCRFELIRVDTMIPS